MARRSLLVHNSQKSRKTCKLSSGQKKLYNTFNICHVMCDVVYFIYSKEHVFHIKMYVFYTHIYLTINVSCSTCQALFSLFHWHNSMLVMNPILMLNSCSWSWTTLRGSETPCMASGQCWLRSLTYVTSVNRKRSWTTRTKKSSRCNTTSWSPCNNSCRLLR